VLRPTDTLNSTLAALVLVAAIPSAALAQTSLSFHASRSPDDGAAWLYGATFGVTRNGFGLRAGGAARRTETSADFDRDLLWTTDADFVLSPTLLGGADPRRTLVPYGFIGAGMQSGADDASMRNAVPHWSWGGGLTVPLFSALSLVGEARSRTLFNPSDAGAISTDRHSTEVRVGFGLNFGGRARNQYVRTSSTKSLSSTRAPTPTVSKAAVPSTRSAVLGTTLLPTANRYLGVQYREGGTSPASGFDCSGFVQYLFARHDVRLPRTAREQAEVGMKISPRVSALQPGDLMFFAEKGSRISHVAVYAGDNRIIHATGSGGAVRYDDLGTSRGRWFAKRLVAARRITKDRVDLTGVGSSHGRAYSLPLDPPDTAPPPR
jgi:cell wall-associated NlpC family hydrolase